MEKNLIKKLCNKYYEDMVRLRHHFHMHPEIGFKEFKTSQKIKEELRKMNVDSMEDLAGTGVVALIKGKYPGKTLLIRADMDALLINEEADVEYKSKVPGVMHACGHDGHTAALLGTAMVLNEIKHELHGNIKLVFQPAEEGEGGARKMIEQGVLENPKVHGAIACHLWGSVEEEYIEIKEGPLMASCDDFKITIKGKGGHGSTPYLCIDPIEISVQVINNIRSFISRKIDSFQPIVLSFGAIHGGESHNIIPDNVEILGTLRTFDNSIKEYIKNSMEEIIDYTTKFYGGSYEIDFFSFAPTVMNDKSMTELAKKTLQDAYGKDKILECKRPYSGSEDFAFFTNEVPSVMFFVGIKKDEEVIHHNSKFKWDDKNLLIACESLTTIAINFLNNTLAN